MGFFDWLFGKKKVNGGDVPANEDIPDIKAGEWTDAGNSNLNGNEYQNDLIQNEIKTGVMPKGTKKVWSTAGVANVCRDCLRLEGTIIDIDKKFISGRKSVSIPPLHDGCRCVVMYESSDSKLVKNYSPIKRELELQAKCLEYLKTTSLIYDAIEKYFVLIESLDRLIKYSEDDLNKVKLSKRIVKEMKIDFVNDKVNIFNGVIEREYQYQIKDAETLKTNRGKINRIKKLYDSLIDYPDLPSESIKYAKLLVDDYIKQHS